MKRKILFNNKDFARWRNFLYDGRILGNWLRYLDMRTPTGFENNINNEYLSGIKEWFE
jgi:hypothetical protein